MASEARCGAARVDGRGGDDGCAAPARVDDAAARRGVAVSRELLGVDGGPGIPKQLLINPRITKRIRAAASTSRVPPSCALSQVKKFLPQLAAANDVLQRQVRAMPEGHFDIERVDDTQARVIEMDIALVERDDSDTEDEDGGVDEGGSCGTSSDSDGTDDDRAGDGLLPTMPRLRLSQKPAPQARHRIIELEALPAADQPPRGPRGT